MGRFRIRIGSDGKKLIRILVGYTIFVRATVTPFRLNPIRSVYNTNRNVTYFLVNILLIGVFAL